MGRCCLQAEADSDQGQVQGCSLVLERFQLGAVSVTESVIEQARLGSRQQKYNTVVFADSLLEEISILQCGKNGIIETPEMCSVARQIR